MILALSRAPIRYTACLPKASSAVVSLLIKLHWVIKSVLIRT